MQNLQDCKTILQFLVKKTRRILSTLFSARHMFTEIEISVYISRYF